MRTLLLVRHAKSSRDDPSLADKERPLNDRGKSDAPKMAKDIVVDDRLYAAAPEALLRVIRELGDKPKCVMLVGHNPELAELAHRFSDSVTDMPTCAVAEFVFDMKSWSGLGQEEPAKVKLQTPKD